MIPCLISISTVTHIGTLNPSDKGVRGPSHEGLGVSFSMHPQAWESIARLGGNPWWEGNISSCKILDGYSFIDCNKEDLILWGEEEGMVQKVVAYLASWYDDEMESQMEAMFQSYQEALDEVGDLMDEESQVGDSIQKIEALAPTSDLVTAMAAPLSDIGKPSLSALSDLATLWAQRSGLDGIWWEDRLDPISYSAPRGVIFPKSVEKIAFHQVRSAQKGSIKRPGM